MARELDLQTLTLASGGHDPDSGQMCVMEAVAYMAGEPWSDMPQCASPVIAAFCRAWNDTDGPYGEAIRARLRDYIPRLVNSRGTREQEDARAWLATDWLIRVQAPAWMRLAPALVPHAEVLAALPPQTSAAAVRASAAAWEAAWAAASAAASAAARDAARAAARDAARDAASAAVGAAAREAVGAAASAAAWEAAWAAAREAAWASARDAAWASARDAAREAVGAAGREAAWDAAWAAARAAAWASAWASAWAAARDAAWAAARAAAEQTLAPTVAELQACAWGLLDHMLAVTESERSGDAGDDPLAVADVAPPDAW